MLDLKFVCSNISLVKEALKNRANTFNIDEVEVLAEKRKAIINEVEKLKAYKNRASADIGKLKKEGKDISKITAQIKKDTQDIKDLDDKLNEIEQTLFSLLMNIPNIPNSQVPIGVTDQDNVQIRKHLKPTKFNFTPKAHWDIATNLDILDWTRAGKISGSRFTVYKGLGSKLERAIINFMLDTHSNAGYTEIFPPFIVNSDSMQGTGQLPKFETDMFALKDTNYYLIPTAEVPVTNLHRNEILEEDSLPIKYCAYSACFRAEAGSAGKDTRGLIRQHQFNKVELVKFANPKNSYDELESLTSDAENILKTLKLPYRVVCLCTGDLGFSSAKTYDIEVWMPSYNRYVEISSCSNFEDFQARRANIKYRDENKKLQFVHTLNGSGLAVGRTVAAILENYQNEDGTVTVPEALIPYIKVDKIK